ncbi:MAG: KTSC domain-containing protein [Candidatus Delongbacteria bacterium]|nr:KTSC domain-containing protein [Candidatus Delongbacteria bacterium]
MRKFYILFILVFSFSCSKDKQNISNCSQITTPYKSYEEANNTVESVDFKYKDEVNTAKSSWIRGAQYYSCDGSTGYLVYQTDKKEYIHQQVPIEVWKEFKNAESFGRFYIKNLKHKYRVVPQDAE